MLTVTLTLLTLLVTIGDCAENNVCKSFKDYYTIKHNPDCWYDFAADSTTVSTNKLALHSFKVTFYFSQRLSTKLVTRYSSTKSKQKTALF